MKNRSYDKDYEEAQSEEDYFVQDDTYDAYSGPDLSSDPMVADENKKKETRKEKKERLERERLAEEKAALRAEILAEMEAEKTKSSKDSASPKGEESSPEENIEPRRKSRFTQVLMSFLSGNILSKSEMGKVYPFLVFIAFLAFLYIGNVFGMQQLFRRHQMLTQEVKELRAKSLTIASEKMKATRQSNIMLEVERRGLPLKESLEPNKVISK